MRPRRRRTRQLLAAGATAGRYQPTGGYPRGARAVVSCRRFEVLEASVIVIGDEILGGYVTDTNSPWLADRLRAHGVPLTRIHVVPDELPAIDEALSAELARSRPRLILTSGGIGSTPDDVTYEAVAASLGRDLVEDATIGARIDGALDWTAEQGVEVDDGFAWHLKRMARIPADSRLLSGHAGWAPGVAIDVDGGCDVDGGATIVVLPGVPREFRLLVSGALEPQLLAGRNDVPAVAEIEHAFPESALNLTFAALGEQHPDVKLGSYPGRPMLVRLSGAADEVAAAEAFVRGRIEDLAATPGGRKLQEAWSARHAAADEVVPEERSPTTAGEEPR
ncbi:competence/damage-inducible protein A [Nitriliruptoraceae bacterium ZYF776]|nr:competence/damage-inducible protein A [Profundirhabdus halotolerans]